MKGVGIPENLEGSDQINSFLRRFGESISFFHVPSEHNGQQYFCFSFIPSSINIVLYFENQQSKYELYFHGHEKASGF